ncbi:MAG: hypothetical protein NC548_26090 [Lachnospiraceae bacterium]|nr:hypothetical protein [Lachnospiraceae bacterium]
MLTDDALNAFIDDYKKSWILRRFYVRLYKKCYQYFRSVDYLHFDQEGYVINNDENLISTEHVTLHYIKSILNGQNPDKEQPILDIIDSIEEVQSHMSTYYQNYINKLSEYSPMNVLDARYPHYHWAFYCAKNKLGVNDRLNYYTEQLLMKENIDRMLHFRNVIYPNVYRQTWVNYGNDDFTSNKLIQWGEDVLRIYGETETIPERKKKIVFLTGSGISEESGLSTIRDSEGLWMGYPIDKVASADGWEYNPELVNIFFNKLRKEYVKKSPNTAHKIIAYLNSMSVDCKCRDNSCDECTDDCKCDKNTFCEMCNYDYGFNINPDDYKFRDYEIVVVTQNIDKLHELADITNSLNVIRLHGDIMKVCSSTDVEDKEYQWKLHELKPEIDPNMKIKDRWKYSPIGKKRVRPYVVFFGEPVPLYGRALYEIETASLVVIVGTSLTVYPASNLVNFIPFGVPIIYIDPNPVEISNKTVLNIEEKATDGMLKLLDLLKNNNLNI